MPNDLFSPEWTMGSLDSISWVVNILGTISVWIISLGGFCLIILPIGKNVINAIYYSAPKLCDRIDEAKKQKISLKMNGGSGNQISELLGSLTTMFLGVLPNFKALSDFEEGNKDPKQYWIKALPSCILIMCIGVFIFYGYTTRIADKVATFGRTLADAVLLEVDPVAWVDKLPTNLARPDFSTSGADDGPSKVVHEVSSSVYRSVSSTFSKMESESKISTSHAIEEWVTGEVNTKMSAYTDTTRYKFHVSSRVSTFEPSLGDLETGIIDKSSAKFAGKMMVDTLPHGLPEVDTSGRWIRYDITFTEIPKKVANVSNVTTSMGVPSSAWKSVNRDVEITIPTANVDQIRVDQSAQALVSGGNRVSIKFDSERPGVLVIKGASGSTLLESVSGVQFEDVDGNRHNIREIKRSGGNTWVFSAMNDANITDWGFSGKPTPKDSTDGTNTQSQGTPTGDADDGGGI